MVQMTQGAKIARAGGASSKQSCAVRKDPELLAATITILTLYAKTSTSQTQNVIPWISSSHPGSKSP